MGVDADAEPSDPDAASEAPPDAEPGAGTAPESGPGPADPFEAYAAEPVPQAAVGAPGKDGRLELAFAPDEDGRTRLVHDFARVPFHVSGTLDHDPHPDGVAVYVQSPTGGIAQGDRHDVAVAAHPGAVAHVTTGSATKVQSMEANCALADVELTAGEGSHLEYVPEPTILHADARFRQAVTVDLAPSATAVVSETVVPGRLARDERFAFERYRSRFRARGPDGLLAEDAVRMAPGRRDRDDRPGPTAPGVLGDAAVHGSLYVLAPGSDGDRDLSDALHEAAADGDARAGATALPAGAGVAVRALGDRASEVTAALDRAHQVARSALIDAGTIPGRKYP